MSDQMLVRADNISKKFCLNLKRSLWYGVKDISRELIGRTSGGQLRKDEFWAVWDLSFELRRGECLGLIGTNGSGKSTVLKMLNGLIKPDTGKIIVKGNVGALIELGAGFNLILSGRENIYINGTLLGLAKIEIDSRLDAIIDFAGLSDFIDMPVQNYSTGMRVRLGFAIAAQLEPDVLLVDEVMAVGDISFQRKCLNKINEYISNGGAVILVSHDMNLVQSIATKSILMTHGQGQLSSDVNKSIGMYLDNCNSSSKPQIDTLGEQTSLDDKGLNINSLIVSSDSKESVSSGGSLCIEIGYESKLEGEKVSAGFSIWEGKSGMRITTSNSAWEGRTYVVRKGSGSITCHVANLPLIPGQYYIRAGIYDPLTSWPITRKGWEDNPVGFIVLNNGRTGNIRQSIANDIISLNEVIWD